MNTKSAFPIVASTGDPRDGVYCQNGITDLEYFAAHAPVMPSWFKGRRLTPMPNRDPDWKWCEGCQADSDCDGDEKCKALKQYFDDVDKIKKINEVELYFEWPWYYATKMLESATT